MEGKDAPHHVTAEHGPRQNIHVAAGDDTHTAQLIHGNDEDSISRVPGMLAALVSSGGEVIQATYDGFIRLGYKPRVPEVTKPGNPRRRYLSWVDPRRDHHAVMYLDSFNVAFTRKVDQGVLRGMPGVKVRQKEVAFKLQESGGLRYALDAAKAVKR